MAVCTPLLISGAGATADASCSSSDPGIVVTASPNDGAESVCVPGSTIRDDPDVVNQHYTEYDGGSEDSKLVTGLSVAAALADAGVSAPSHGFVAVFGSDGTWLPTKLSAADVDGNAYQSGLKPVVTVASATTRNLGYQRPQQDPSDDNDPDDYGSPSGVSIQLVVHDGPYIPGVTISASQSQITDGQSVTFTATTGATADEQPLTYTWNFDDGTPAETTAGPSVTHHFGQTGVSDVVVGVEGSNDSAGRSGYVEVDTGASDKGSTHHPGGGASPTPAPSSTSPSQPTPGSGGHHPRATHRATKKGSRLGAHLPELDLPADGRGITSTGGGPGQQPQIATSGQGLPLVSGQLLSGTAAAISASQLASQLASAQASKTDTSRHLGALVTWLSVGVAVTALLGAGVASETGWRPRPPKRRRASTTPEA